MTATQGRHIESSLVEANQLGRGNDAEIAEWCGGKIVFNVLQFRGHRGLPGDWVLRRGNYWTVISDEQFKATYEPA